MRRECGCSAGVRSVRGDGGKKEVASLVRTLEEGHRGDSEG